MPGSLPCKKCLFLPYLIFKVTQENVTAVQITVNDVLGVKVHHPSSSVLQDRHAASFLWRLFSLELCALPCFVIIYH